MSCCTVAIVSPNLLKILFCTVQYGCIFVFVFIFVYLYIYTCICTHYLGVFIRYKLDCTYKGSWITKRHLGHCHVTTEAPGEFIILFIFVGRQRAPWDRKFQPLFFLAKWKDFLPICLWSIASLQFNCKYDKHKVFRIYTIVHT